MIELPQGQWLQTNISDKFGNIWYTKNMNFDEQGYMKLSPRMVRLISETDDGNFGLPLAIGRQGVGDYQVATADANWGVTVSATASSIDEDTGSSNPSTTLDSHAVWFGGLWNVTTNTAILTRPATGGASQAYTSQVTGLTSGKNHKLCVFKSRTQLCVANGNVVKQYTSGYVNTIDLTIPSDYEIIDLAYNNSQMAVLTKLSNDGTVGQDQEATLFIWNGATTGAQKGVGLGSDSGVAVYPYKSSFVVITRSGQRLYWNGGGFEELTPYPFFNTEKIYGDAFTTTNLGNVFTKVDGNVAYENIGIELDPFNQKAEVMSEEMPSGIWCGDLKVGLYHRYSPSISDMEVLTVTGANIDTSTNIFTIASGNIPSTGGIARLVQTVGIDGLTLNHDYYIIYLSSTTFKLAETKEHALAGVAVDITSATAGNNYFHVYNLVDYGQGYYVSPGAVALTGDNSQFYTDIIAGARLYDTDLTSIDSLCIAVPHLYNIGTMVSPKLFSAGEKDKLEGITVFFRPLNSKSEIIVKARHRDIYGLPVTSSLDEGILTGSNQFTTVQDISEAKTYLDAGGELELEIRAGTGAGQYVEIESIDTDGTTYSVTVKEDILGAVAGRKFEFIINNWKYIRTITNDDNEEGFVTCNADMKSGKFAQFKLEIRGSDVCIEKILYNNLIHSS